MDIDIVGASLDGLWILMGIVLVFFMQAGFAMVEAGLTRAKNTGNIIMKNMLDFCIGSIAFYLLGYGLMHGLDAGGFLGIPINPFASFDPAHFMFHMVFCATAATIVSGAMAERTKFSSYCVYSFVMSLVVYPISGHWIWGGGWLAELGFRDFAGSTAVHMVGGIAALIGAKILGPRIGKYTKDEKGKTVSKAIPGHNIALAALGVFILWFGWYGFNGASEYAIVGEHFFNTANIFITTTLAASAGTVTAMIITWVQYKKPDVSMTLNGSLAGLVAITAGCAYVSPAASIIIGIISGFLVVYGVEFIDKKLKIDDPVGAIGVHALNGAFGTILVGVFAKDKGIISGFIYNPELTAAEAFTGLGIQILGVVTVAFWVALIMIPTYLLIKKTIGLRASKEHELAGLDISEHGLVSAYAGFTFAGEPSVTVGGIAEPSIAVPVEIRTEKKAVPSDNSTPNKYTNVTILCNQNRFDGLKHELGQIGITGLTVTQVLGCGMQKGKTEFYRGVPVEPTLLPKVKTEVIVCKVPVDDVVKAARKALYTGHIGDGKIFIYNVENVIKIRTSEEGYDALQDTI